MHISRMRVHVASYVQIGLAQYDGTQLFELLLLLAFALRTMIHPSTDFRHDTSALGQERLLECKTANCGSKSEG
jgi:hypothetical protein